MQSGAIVKESCSHITMLAGTDMIITIDLRGEQ
jgi:hypothetical protein